MKLIYGAECEDTGKKFGLNKGRITSYYMYDLFTCNTFKTHLKRWLKGDQISDR